MRTTLNIDADLLDDVVAATGEKSKTKAVNAALQDYVRHKKLTELREMFGKMDFDLPSKEERLAADKRREQFLDSLRAG